MPAKFRRFVMRNSVVLLLVRLYRPIAYVAKLSVSCGQTFG